jgi:outer membrane lipoprotein-sorting protein
MTVKTRTATVFLVSLWSLVAFVYAQDLSGETVLAHVRETLEELQDASFVLTGRINDDSEEYEVEFQVILDQKLVRAHFVNPLAVADNILVLDDQDVYNYYFLTDQVTIFDFRDNKAFGNLLLSDLSYYQANARIDPTDIDLNYDVSELLAGWGVEVTGYSDSSAGSVYHLDFTNPASGQNDFISLIRAEILDGEWHPTRIEVILKNGTDTFELFVQSLVTNSGLEPSELRLMPVDAEVIDGR